MSLVAELQRRRVIRALVGYGIAAFAVLQIVEPIMHGLHWPETVLSYTVVALAVGFPIVVSLAWIFDVNAGRIERRSPAAPAMRLRGARLAFLLVGIGILAAAPGTIWYFVVRGHSKPATETAASTATTVPAAPSIAVLAFADMSPGKDQEYFSDGIAEEILNALGQVEGLRVIGRTSSFSFKGKSADLRTIGQELNVGTVLEGSVRKAGDKVRITTQLISSADGTHLWSETYDRNLTEVFAVQDEIARAVVAALKLKLLPARAESPTANPEAHNQFLLGLHFFQQGSSDGNARALEALEKAVALDPGFARGWAKLSTVRFVNADQNWAQYPPERFFPAALEAADKAIALAPSEAMGWVARGAFRTNWSKDWAAARSDLERALALAPDNADVLTSYGVLLSTLGQLPQAIAAVRKAAAVDPLRDRTWNQLAHYQLGTGEFDQAEANAARAVQLAPNSARSLRTLGFARLLQHKLDGAWTAFDSEKDDGASGTLYRLMGAALVEQDKGNKAESQRLVDEIIRKPFAVSASYQIAQVLAWQGQADRAFEWLERAYEQHDAGLNFLKYDPLLRNLRGDPRYTELLKKMKLPLD